MTIDSTRLIYTNRGLKTISVVLLKKKYDTNDFQNMTWKHFCRFFIESFRWFGNKYDR